MKTELVTTLKRKAACLLSAVDKQKEPVLITEHGRPAACLVDVQTFDTKTPVEGRLDSSAVKPRVSRIHGRGLFAQCDLSARRKLGEIGGCLVKLPEARRAVEALSRIYIIELSRRLALDCSKGNAFKYLNHSCAPNCFLRIYRKAVEVYTLRRISRGTELTVDYGVTPHMHGMKCLCGSPKCRRKV